jgi:hypothetical protein
MGSGLWAVVRRWRVGVCPMVTCSLLVLLLAGGAAWGSSSGNSVLTSASVRPDLVLTSVSCSSSRACTAVGGLYPMQYADGPGVPVAERWNGRRWSLQRMATGGVGPAASYGVEFAVSCPSRSECFAVGGITVPVTEQGGGETDATVPLVERWNRGRWSIQKTPKLPGASPLTPGGPRAKFLLGDVSCTSMTACTAIGYGPKGGPLAEHWNGRKWSIQRSAPGIRLGLQFVSCPSTRDCVSVGQVGSAAEAEEWSGARWSRHPMRTDGFLTGFAEGSIDGLSCGSKTACLAVGSWSTSCPSFSPDLEMCAQGGLLWWWNGSRWSLAVPRNPRRYPAAVSCVRSASVCIDFLAAGGMRLWNGLRWVARSSPAFPSGVGDTSCTSVTACMAVGYGGTGSFVWWWNGNRWIGVTPRTPSAAPTTG